jgi:hypothetical protein
VIARPLLLALLGLLAGCEWVRLPTDGDAHDADDDGYDSEHDCDDFNENAHPGAPETCNGVDNDCSGDEDDATDAPIWYPDADGDGFGDAGGWRTACDQPAGYVANAGDCNDADPAWVPGALEDDCSDPADYNCDGFSSFVDSDGDGWAGCEDCDDTRAVVSPGAPELCDGVDDDCDGVLDEDLPGRPWYADADGDGWGDPALSISACGRPDGFSADGTDCDDADPVRHPDASELCDGVDDDCDGTVDEEDPFGSDRWYADADGDGFGDPDDWAASCTAVEGRLADGTDCDDTDPAVSPIAAEHCDGIDENCNGTLDDGAAERTTWYADTDGDGYGDAARTLDACVMPPGYAAAATDCDDADATVHPDGIERCGGGDEDCDGLLDEAGATGGPAWYADGDGDGWGDASDSITACTEPAGYVASAGDCDDADAAFHPGAFEIDCDDPNDYNCDGSTGYADVDRDGWEACEDCDDSAAAINPTAAEICDAIDDDCDGTIDLGATDGTDWWPDADADGYGDASRALVACVGPGGWIGVGDDCDDADAAVNPAATEACGTAYDDDCDGVANGEGADGCADWYVDADEDGYGAEGGACLCVATAPYTTAIGEDCDDADASVNPDGTEVCGDGVDDDCDGLATGCGLAGLEPLADAESKLVGQDPSEAFGAALAAAGDEDGDGYADLFVGATGGDDGGVDAGDVHLFAGPLPALGSTLDAIATFYGEAAGDAAGDAVTAGDYDGDGLVDLVVGASLEDSGGRNAGAAYLVLGPLPVRLGLAAADGKRTGTDVADCAGSALATFGGAADSDMLAIGAYRESLVSGRAGVVYVYDTAPTGTASVADATATLVGESSLDFFGQALAGVGDTDGDGLDDLAVGAYGTDLGDPMAGTAYLFRAPIVGTVAASAADARRYGGERSSWAGFGVSNGGDVDGDGLSDFFVGAIGVDGVGNYAGAAYLVSGPATGDAVLGADATLLGVAGYEHVGRALVVGDFDSDDYADVAIAGDGVSYGTAGAVWVAYGPLSGVTSVDDLDTLATGEARYDHAGLALAAPGDTDGDGYVDLAVGAAENDTSNTDAGAIYLLTGGPGF